MSTEPADLNLEAGGRQFRRPERYAYVNMSGRISL
ncbi:hypothetical protein T08_11287 [Trichinella sp. T8]|nr:hypothetical protein T08_11287 [Trichinella sp. T8]